MIHPALSNCPVCNHTLTIKKLHCNNCHTTIENDFALSKFSMLSGDELAFIETFLISRGNIKEVEKELGISYPTVRGKLNTIIAHLGHDTSKQEHTTDEGSIISMLEKGDMTADEAVKQLKSKRGRH